MKNKKKRVLLKPAIDRLKFGKFQSIYRQAGCTEVNQFTSVHTDFLMEEMVTS